MSSLKQQQANRLNAQKSCGPRTLQGKAISRFNALKTGMDAESQIIPGEDPAAFQKLTEEYHQRWQPTLPEERFLVDTLAHDEWQLRRLRKAEAIHWHYRLEKDPYSSRKNNYWNGAGGNDFARLQRRMDSTERSYRLTLEKLECLAEQSDPSGADLPVCLSEDTRPTQAEPPACPSPSPAPAAEVPDPHEAEPLLNQPPSHGIGFVPSIPAATFRKPFSSIPRPAVVAVSTVLQRNAPPNSSICT
jgi:hypothetical protein